MDNLLTEDSPPSTSTTRVSLPCVHCGEPTEVVATHDPKRVFCCNGCRGAYELIGGLGLEEFYALRDQVMDSAAPVRAHATRFDCFDSEAFLGPSTPKETSDGTMVTDLAVQGLHCAACAWLIENAALQTSGWSAARVRMNDHTLRIAFDPQKTSLSRIAALVHRLGYGLTPLSEERSDQFKIENRRLLIQIAIAGFCAANAMWIAVALYAGGSGGVAANHRVYLESFGMFLGLLAVFVPGRTFFQGALASLRTRTPHMDLPVALGLSVGSASGVVAIVTGTGQVYFDSLAVLVFLLLIGRWIQFRQQHRAASALDLMLRITPRHAMLVNEEDTSGEQIVLVEHLREDDLVRVAAGESVPVDGSIVRGHSAIDRALLTGESHPETVGEGDWIAAGTVNLGSPIDVRVKQTGRDSRIGKVMQSVEEAMADRAPIAQLADSIGGIFVVAVTTLAVLTFVYWVQYGLSQAVANATSLLIVACPCALALATPLAIAMTIGRAAKRKILIREGSTLQQLARPGEIWFDKTGTLTQGRVRVDLVCGDEEAVQKAAILERHCNHPIATAVIHFAEVLNFAKTRKPKPVWDDEVQAFRVEDGGVTGIVMGETINIGSPGFLERGGCFFDESIRAGIHQCLQTGESPAVISVDGVAVCVLRVTDPIRPQASDALTELKRRGWKIGILSGDHPRIVSKVARQLGLDSDQALGGLSPEDKLAKIRNRQSLRNQSQASFPIVMIGDGANDAAALAAADVGIAVRGGAEVSLQAAPIFVATGKTSSIVQLILGAKRSLRLIHTAFAVSLAYNIIAVALAMTGQISPLVAAVFMPVSSVSVLTLVLAWPIFREDDLSFTASQD